jgi:hypothetical protein
MEGVGSSIGGGEQVAERHMRSSEVNVMVVDVVCTLIIHPKTHAFALVEPITFMQCSMEIPLCISLN